MYNHRNFHSCIGVSDDVSMLLILDQPKHYVNITFESKTMINCKFLSKNWNTTDKSCTLVYEQCGARQDTLIVKGFTSTESSNTITIDLKDNAQSCSYYINATYGNMILQMKGMLLTYRISYQYILLQAIATPSSQISG